MHCRGPRRAQNGDGRDHAQRSLRPCTAPSQVFKLVLDSYYMMFLAKRKGASADKLQVTVAGILPLVGLARSKQDPSNREQSKHD